MGSGVEVARSVGAGTGVITSVGFVVELGAELIVVLLLLLEGVEKDNLRTVDVVVVGAAVTVSVFSKEDDEEEEDAAPLVVGR